VADEEVVMRGSSRHGPSRPDRARRPAADGGAPRHEGRPGRRQPDTRAAGSQPAGAAAPDRPQAARPAEPERLTSLLEPVVRSAGLDLESVRISAAGRRWLLRVVVDADNGPGLDEIALVSRSVSAELDASGVMGQAAYTLEVSSPGVDRPLAEPRHWRRAVGRLVYAPLSRPAPAPLGKTTPSSQTEPARYLTAVQGRVVAAGADAVTLEIDGERREFGYRDLGPGRVQVEFSNVRAAGAASGEPGDEGERDGH
jgi:ribosome maturation factor RimP